MSHWFARIAVFIACVALIAIRAPHGHRSLKVAIRKSYKGALEKALLPIAMLSFFVPVIWVVTPLLSFADYPLRPPVFYTGLGCYIIGLMIFHRSHTDLGTNWSVSLEVRETHTLVTNGVYQRVRHPMYTALLIYSLGQTLALPNYFAGPSYLVVMTLLIAVRLPQEERMMREEFGAAYDEYCRHTKRLIPGVF
ncbi:MAG: isoprenylcysteine carboxylmethyltransferase family protein [Phycisphaerales bacterium]|nr:isoprenylcysteine carboxylmethyltransferase family protein [Phycisphaerales bacterium]